MSTTKNLISCLAALALAVHLAAHPALAQAKGPNGGMLGGKDDHMTELVIGPTELTVYLIDKGKVHSAKGAVVRAVIQQGGNNTTVNLAVVEGRKLVGRIAAPVGKGAIIVITGKDDHGHAVNARFVIN